MTDTNSDRKIAVILVADAVGYSKHMEKDENSAIESYKACEAILSSLLAKYNGSIFNTGGDSVLAEFSSAVNAVECSVEFQKAIKKRNASEETIVKIEFRLGINMGDVVQTQGNLLGDGVNIAARLEALCLPGSVSISKSVHDLVIAKTSLSFNDQGIQKVKENEFHVYDILIDPSHKRNLKTTSKSKLPLLAMVASIVVAGLIGVFYLAGGLGNSAGDDNKLSLDTIAIVPLQVQSEDIEIKNLAAGIFQETVSGLSRSGIEINAKPIKLDTQDIVKEAINVNAQYILSGTLLKGKNSVRTNMKLIRTDSEDIIWSNTFEGDLNNKDVFEVQDRMVNEIVDTLAGNGHVLVKDVSARIIGKPSDELTQFECIAVTLDFLKSFLKDHYPKALDCLNKSLDEDPSNAKLHAYLSNIKISAIQQNYVVNDKEILNEAIKNVDQAIALNPELALGHFVKGRAYFLSQNWKSMFDSLEVAVKLAPDDLEIVYLTGFMMFWSGNCSLDDFRDQNFKRDTYTIGDCRWKVALDLLKKAEDMDPRNYFPGKHYALSMAYEYWGANDSSFFEKAYNQVQLARNPGFFWYHMRSATTAAGMDREDLANEHFGEIKKILGSSKIEDAYSHHVNWNLDKTYWLVSKPILSKYGFD